MKKTERNTVLKIAIYGDLLLQSLDERNTQVKKYGRKETLEFINLVSNLEKMIDVAYENKEIRSSSKFQEMQNKIETIIRKNTIV